jgi:hypothetical protein
LFLLLRSNKSCLQIKPFLQLAAGGAAWRTSAIVTTFARDVLAEAGVAIASARAQSTASQQVLLMGRAPWSADATTETTAASKRPVVQQQGGYG